MEFPCEDRAIIIIGSEIQHNLENDAMEFIPSMSGVIHHWTVLSINGTLPIAVDCNVKESEARERPQD